MRRQPFNFRFLLSLYITGTVLCACTRSQQNWYIRELKNNLPLFDSLSMVLSSKYAARSIERPTIIYPAEKDLTSDHYRIYDTSINSFCQQHDVRYIEVQSLASNATDWVTDVTYFLSDPNFQYVYNSKGQPRTAPFENTRVRVIPINNRWIFQYEKPNF